MEWYRQVQFVAAVAMPSETAREYGTTVNGMWADPESRAPEEVAEDHVNGARVLFSVPMIALVPRVYEAEGTAYLLGEVCRDIGGERAQCDWYYWETKPVYAVCIYSDEFRRYLFDRCVDGVDRGMDVVNLDEIMTSVGLMNREPHGSGFCSRCFDRFRTHQRNEGNLDLADRDDETLRSALRGDDGLYEAYRRFHEHGAYQVMVGFIEELRAYAAVSPDFAISANVAYLGSLVPTFGALWGCMWGRHVDFILMENHYRIEHSSPHLLLPRGSFAASYRLGSAVSGEPAWICPSITVPRQLAGQQRTGYHVLMFLEAYANAGRWGYYWWPGVDAKTRLEATAPESLKDYIRFISKHHELYEESDTANELAILYADGAISRRREAHAKYLSLAQALAECGIQFDVVYGGDGRFNPDRLDPSTLGKYRAIILPEARELGTEPTAALDAFAHSGGDLVTFSPSPLERDLVREVDGQVLVDFWRHYRDADRELIAQVVSGPPSARIAASDPAVRITRFGTAEQQILHLLDYGYDEATDTVSPIQDLTLRIPWQGSAASCVLLDLDGEHPLASRVEGDALRVGIPRLDRYAVLVASS